MVTCTFVLSASYRHNARASTLHSVGRKRFGKLMLALTIGMVLLHSREAANLRLLAETGCEDLCKGTLNSKCNTECEGKSHELRDSNPAKQPSLTESSSGLTTADETASLIASANNEPTAEPTVEPTASSSPTEAAPPPQGGSSNFTVIDLTTLIMMPEG